MTASARRLARAIPPCAAIALLWFAGCGDTNAFQYDYTGTLVARDGTPAAGVKLFVTDAAGEALCRSDDAFCWELWRTWGPTTDSQGQFASAFNGDGTYWKWLGILPPAPPAKPLDGVYVLANLKCQWRSWFVPIDAKSQATCFEGGRRLELGRILLPEPAPTTRPAAGRTRA